ncbi:hypothetical protein AB6735_14995 [Mucilaginibacter sp. RCC_168]|uniref:hypothetical protein n=1 Tax=Mucilaginibacter sp. RCC_168 TaxID=3239221 RepID=UPI003524A1AB
MSFWRKTGYSYQSVVEISEPALLQLVNGLTRTDIIEWLMWNDPNGIYSDERSEKEFGTIMSREEGLEIMLRQAEENRIIT